MNPRQPSLMFCIFMDLIGFLTSSYVMPVFGDLADVIWAPVSGLIFFIAFGGWKGALGGIFDMVEELLPGTASLQSHAKTFKILFHANTRKKIKTQMDNSKLTAENRRTPSGRKVSGSLANPPHPCGFA
jgi:hypothetical protein